MISARLLRLYVALVILLATLCACKNQPARHQQGGRSSQSLSAPASPVPPAAPAAPSQTLAQPENPEGESRQEITRTVTTTTPDGSVVTTVEKASTVIGGSQDLADILKEYMLGKYMSRIATALVLALIAWLIRKNWPLAALVLGIGALVVARYGEGYAVLFAVAAGALFVAYNVIMAQIPRNPFTPPQ